MRYAQTVRTVRDTRCTTFAQVDAGFDFLAQHARRHLHQLAALDGEFALSDDAFE